MVYQQNNVSLINDLKLPLLSLFVPSVLGSKHWYHQTVILARMSKAGRRNTKASKIRFAALQSAQPPFQPTGWIGAILRCRCDRTLSRFTKAIRRAAELFRWVRHHCGWQTLTPFGQAASLLLLHASDLWRGSRRITRFLFAKTPS
jgi:hypothetical protein